MSVRWKEATYDEHLKVAPQRKGFVVSTLSYEGGGVGHKLDFYFDGQFNLLQSMKHQGRIKMRGSANGLVLLLKEPNFVLLNPNRFPMPFSAICDFQSLICEICLEEKLHDDLFAIKGCSHSYCSDCICKYIASKLKLKIFRIGCPEPQCLGQLDPQHFRSIIAHQVFDKWTAALFSQACKKYAPEKGDIMLHKLARTMGWKQCPGCNIYIEKFSHKRQWSVEEAELDPAYKVQFVLDEILDESSEFCNSMNCGEISSIGQLINESCPAGVL